MANIAIATGQTVAISYPMLAETYPVILAETVTRGQATYQVAASGKFGVAGAAAAGKQQFRGVMIDGAGGLNEGRSILRRGFIDGYDLSALAYDAPVYLSDTLGLFSTTAGTLPVIVGRVFGKSDAARTKCLYIDADWVRLWV